MALSTWLCIFTKRDQSKALDFIQNMKKVTPAMGIAVRNVKYRVALCAQQTLFENRMMKMITMMMMMMMMTVFSIIIIIAGCVSKIGVCVQKFQVKAKFQPFYRFSVKSNLHASYKFKTDLDFFLLPTLNFCNNMLLLLEVITLTFNIILICIGLV